MIDHEKVKKGLECCLHSSKSHCDKCPYIYESLCSINYCTADLASDVLDLLKENPDIVRCENCKFAEKQLFGAKESEYKCMLSESWGLYDFHNKDWYCPDGKGRETND